MAESAPSTALTDAMRAFAPSLPVAVAFSGGADSTALLVACAQKFAGQVRAIHVHHGLQNAADAFERHCAAVCEKLQVPLSVVRVDARHAPGESPEDAARKARYEALRAAVMQPTGPLSDVRDIALAQHADDQVETLLLALSRGAGLGGLAAMPAQWERDGLRYHRPLLDVPGADLRNWLTARDIGWVEDPTNVDERFTRNRIRARLLPALEDAFPQFRGTFGRSAKHAAQAQALLHEVATQDLAQVGVPPVIAQLQRFTRARQANLLRHWLKTAHAQQGSAAQLHELLDQVAACTTRGHHIRIKVGTGYVQRNGAALEFAPASGP
jgi:tRNA(Ile)-lysidine synthase